MKNEQNALAGVVASDLRAVEHGLDETLARVGAMLQNLTEGRRRVGLGARIGQHALTAVGEMITGTIAARADIVRAHDRFAREAARLGLDPTVMGPLEPKGDDTPETPVPTGRFMTT